jgi:hypothetical protein
LEVVYSVEKLPEEIWRRESGRNSGRMTAFSEEI